MGKAKGDNKNLSGKIGTKVYVRRKDGLTIVYEAPEKPDTPKRSVEQMRIRMQWSNLGAVHTQFHKTLRKGFQNVEGNMSDYNAFVQANTGVCKVYIPKWVRLNGGCVLAPYLVTRGKLPSIGAAKNSSNVLVTDLALGSLVIDATTTVGELSAAILAYNTQWEEGDQLSFFYGTQTVDSVTGTPRANIEGSKILIRVNDDTLLWNVVPQQGFSSSAGYLSMGMAITDGAAVWVHSREGQGGTVQVGTQYLYVDSSVLASYQTNEAFRASADSYGGVNTEEAFLDPRATRRGMADGGGQTDGESGGGTNVTPTPTTNVTITANVNDDSMGSVTGGGTYVQGASVTLTATANEGYHFVSWSNGRTTASITVTADADATYTATFAVDGNGGNSGDNSGLDG